MSKTYAFAQKDSPSIVALWCEKRACGYYVINGDWSFHQQSEVMEGLVLVWEGEVPEETIGHNGAIKHRGYNEAMAWIQDLLDA